MSLINVKNVEHSFAPHGGECLTQEWTYPRAIHAEVMTHRDKSRNAESSRAIPVLTKLAKTAEEPWIPRAFTKNKRGMQGGSALDGDADVQARTLWDAGFSVIEPLVKKLAKLEVHKQYANRLAEPWATITVVITGTEWENMDALRAHPEAMPEFQDLMWAALDERMLGRYERLTARKISSDHATFITSNPRSERLSAEGQRLAMFERNPLAWHLPYVGLEERQELGLAQAIKCSVARCARVSYLLQDGTKANVEKDNELYERLLTSGHMSPFEHQATPLQFRDDSSGNFRGWMQYRKTIPAETRTFNYWDACEKAGRTPAVPRPA